MVRLNWVAGHEAYPQQGGASPKCAMSSREVSVWVGLKLIMFQLGVLGLKPRLVWLVSAWFNSRNAFFFIGGCGTVSQNSPGCSSFAERFWA